MQNASSWIRGPVMKWGLGFWLVFHIAANAVDLIPVLPGLHDPKEWEEPRFREEWRKWSDFRGASLPETQVWWQTWGTRLLRARDALRSPFAWYLDSLGFSQEWDVFRAGTRLAPVLEIYGRTCRPGHGCRPSLLFRYGEGGSLEDAFQNIRMRSLVASWTTNQTANSWRQKCQVVAKHLSLVEVGLQEVECKLSLIATPSTKADRERDDPIVIAHERVMLPLDADQQQIRDRGGW